MPGVVARSGKGLDHHYSLSPVQVAAPSSGREGHRLDGTLFRESLRFGERIHRNTHGILRTF